MMSDIRSRLFYKQAFASVLIALAIGAVLSGIQIYSDMQNERARIESMGANLLLPLTDSLARIAYRLDRTAAQDLLTGLLQEKAVIRGEIIDDFGDVLVAVAKPADRKAIQNLGRVFGNTPKTTEQVLVIKDPGMRVGTVRLQIDPLVAAEDFSRRTAIVLATGMLKSLLLSALLSAYFMHTSTRRIERLSRQFLSEGETSKGEGDEIDKLESVLLQWREEKVDLIAELDLSLERMTLAASAAKLGVWDFDFTADELVWDDGMLELFEVAPGGFHGTFEDWRRRVHPDDLGRVEGNFRRCLETGALFSDRFRIITDRNDVRVVSAYAKIMRTLDGKAVRAIGINVNVTQDARREQDLIRAREETEAALCKSDYEARHDTLTGLPNRRALEEYLEKLHERLDGDCDVCFLQIDLDRFKSINDAFGHCSGDRLLVEIGERLRSVAARQDFAARIGGDEFAVVVTDPNRVAQAGVMAQAIIESCAKPVLHDKQILRSGASIGIAVEKVKSLGQLKENADIALYEAKRGGRNRCVQYDEAHRVAAEQRKRLADRLTEAIAQDDLYVALQPQIDAGSLALAGYEALVRWTDPLLGHVAPDRFLPIADEIGVLAQIDELVFTKALETVRALQEDGIDVPGISVNVSIKRLLDPALLDSLDALMPFPCKVAFELLETIDFDLMDDHVLEILRALQERGVMIEIDDFGSGHASVSALTRILPDRIKLDRTITRLDCKDGVDCLPIVKAIADMAAALHIGVTAEGVETEEQAICLCALGCETLQGYYFAPPMDAEGIRRWVAERREKQAEPVVRKTGT